MANDAASPKTPDHTATDPKDSFESAAPTPFHDLDDYVALPRTGGLAVSPDGRRLVTTVATLGADKTTYVSAVWQIDPMGEAPAYRLTRSAKGEAGAAFLPSGDLLFTSARPDPDSKDDDEVPMLWLLPVSGGEARVVARRPGGIGGPVVARETGTIVVSSSTFPSSADAGEDAATRSGRKDQKVSAILHERYPIRYWDHDIGPDLPRLFVGSVGSVGSVGHDEQVELRDLTPDAGAALLEAEYDITPDGSTVVAQWHVLDVGSMRSTVVAIDVETGERRALLDDDTYEYAAPAVSPDGSRVVVVREAVTTPTDPPDRDLVVVSLVDGSVTEVAADWDRWPSSVPSWTPDGSALIVTADDLGRRPVFRIDVATGTVTALTVDDATFTDAVVSPDGQHVYALRTSYLAPSTPVRIDASTVAQQAVAEQAVAEQAVAEQAVAEQAVAEQAVAEQAVAEQAVAEQAVAEQAVAEQAATLPAPAPSPTLPGTLTEVSTVAADGVTVRGWLALPEGASAAEPAPLLLWIHGGPLHSWNAWQWRWNPWLMVARGYAVLLPDPALSTGYGLEFIRRGWGRWGDAPYTDLMAITDVVEQRDDIDAGRTAAMGGSFGGYMANWIAGSTDRFDAIVTHASLWALDQFSKTTDASWYWEQEMSQEMTEAHSPHHRADAISTPMLVIHGDKDYRVPIGEALRLWRDLTARAKPGTDFPHKFLYFPDENHWILSPGHAKVWYETVHAFLAHHVLGQDWEPPALLR